ncbi:large ribosomal subunit protein uL18c isoform X1 [Lycium barbarum]|uniref:large ribosomal subunit protein uL18c isoform X1 n=1 Tax=Lycium barbarum TaxID=112863 RepID=UPI00293ED14E|nr:large ribosomal subunit protein uL18c isoform X1 [Lycium barbarum]
MSCASFSLSFLHNACADSKQFTFQVRPKLVIQTTRALTIEAKAKTRREDRTARHIRIRKKVEGTTERPRLCVFRSNKHIYVQVIDDSKMHTMASASTMQKPISEEFDYSAGPTAEVAKKVGEAIAKACLEKGITKVAFDRGGYPYHGRIEALAEAARENGLQF